jgi:hypothetical protein
VTGPADIPRGLPVPQDAAPTASDLDRLLAECVERAGQTLQQQGAFWPFALCLTTDGQLAEQPTPEDVLVLLRGALRSGRDELRATAVASDVQVKRDPGADAESALMVELQARGGDALALVVPYTREGDRPVFSQPLGQPGAHPTWS